MKTSVLATGACLLLTALSCSCGGATPSADTPDQQVVAPATEGKPPKEVAHGCPDELRVTVIMPFETKDGKKWMLHDRELEGDSPSAPDIHPLSDEEKANLSASDTGAAVWVFRKDEEPPCRMEAGAPWSLTYGDGPLRTNVGYELTGKCELDPESYSYLALRGSNEARGCRMHALPMVASDEHGEGKPPPKEVADVLPDHKCDEANCFRWLYKGAHVDSGAGVYEVAAVWLHPPEGDDPPCSAPFDGFHGAYFRSAQSAKWQEMPGVSEVRALLYDERGLRGVVTDSHGTLGLLVPAGSGLPVKAQEHPYLSWNEENQTDIEMLEPSCL